MSKNILITGSGGFIGKNLKEYFSAKFNVLSPRSSELNLLDSSAVNSYFSSHNIDIILHCGAVGARVMPGAEKEIADKNILMFKNLASNLKPNQFMINFGSGAEYDKSRALKKIKEIDFGKFIPSDPYGYSKYVISKEIEKLENILNIRLFGVYGKYENESRFPTYAISQNLKKEPIIINRNVVFDYLYIEDLYRVIETFIQEKPIQKFINVTPTKSISLYEIAQIVNEISDFKSEIIIKNSDLNNDAEFQSKQDLKYKSRVGIPAHGEKICKVWIATQGEYTGDNSRLLCEIKDFQHLPFTSYEEGLKNLYEFLRAEIKSLTL